MVEIKNLDEADQIILFLKQLKIRQEEYSDTELFCYPKISLYLAAKHKLFIPNFLLHPLVLSIKTFYEDRMQIDEEEIKDLLAEVLEFEFLEKETFLTTEELKYIIQVHKNL